MTQAAALPSATAQRQAAVEVFAQYEPPLYEAYLEMMVEWLAAVRAAMFAGGVARLGLVPNPMTVFSQTPKWAALTSRYAADVAREVLAAPYRDLFGNGDLFESRPFVRNWIAQRENRLSQVPNEVFSAVAQIVDSATTNGASIPDVTQQVEELLDATGSQRWPNRARTVARTEVVGAYNGGLHDAFSMVVDASPDITWMRRWLATDDTRTRPDHREADGQLVPWSQPFIVGGFAMMHPHDPAGPPQEVINCRCVELLEIENEPTEMTHRQSRLSLRAFAGQIRTLADAGCQFCMQTHKPGLCKGQKRGEVEPGTQDANQAQPAQRAATAVRGLSTAIARAQQVEARAALTNPKLAQAARRAIVDYAKALRGHQQTLRQAARANTASQRVGKRDTTEQDMLDRRQQQHRQALEKRAQAIIARRAEQAKLAKMGPKQRAAYQRQKAAQAAAKRKAAENQVLKEAGKK